MLKRILFFAAVFSISLSSHAGKIKTVFQEEELSHSEFHGGFVQSEEDGTKNKSDIPLKKTRAGIIRTPKENVFGDVIPDSSLFFRSSLEKRLKDAYDEIYTALSAYNDELFLQTKVERQELHNLLIAVYNDNPEIFWWVGNVNYSFNSDGTITKVVFNYIFPKEEAQKRYDEFYAMSVPIIFYASLLENDMDKIKYVHDFLCLSTEYDTVSFNSGNYGGKLQSAWSAVVEYKTVCAGYSRAFQYYMQQLSIPCAVLQSDSHAWNILSVGGNCYEMDVTWDDNTLYPPYFNLQHREMCGLDYHSPDEISKKVIDENPDGSIAMNYEEYFRGILQGEPYTYRELENFEEDIKNPSEAVIFKKPVKAVDFVKDQEDFEKVLGETVSQADSTSFSLKFIVTNTAALKSVMDFLKNETKFAVVIRRRWPNCGYSYRYSYSSGDKNISYKLEVNVNP